MRSDVEVIDRSADIDIVENPIARLRFRILGVVKKNPLFFHSISYKNNGFLFTTPNILSCVLFIFMFRYISS